ncbi:MAG TPA: tRNA pseudouridine(55) synthase TruB [Pyrinomonadaceae bacterium]|nr:tRNA pseudouridine(55) synthase TruB [Pyrinomonadaceae bacterium]
MDGVAIIDKPAGMTSHDVVARVRRILGVRRVGHTGTLDPFATGVLVLLVGRATRLAQFLSGADKEYEAVIRFGYATDTGDATGEPRQTPLISGPLEDCAATLGDREINAALRSLRGEIEQVPPMYSAKKVKGKKLYEFARRGEEIERSPVRVIVHEFESVRRGGRLLQHHADGTCDLCVRVVCSAGTYVRALAESVGERLGVAAHLASLRRTRAGSFKIEGAMSLDKLQEMAEAGEAANFLLSPDAALSEMPFVHLRVEEARRVCHGVAVHFDEVKWQDGERVRVLDERGNLIAIGIFDANQCELRPRIVLALENKH